MAKAAKKPSCTFEQLQKLGPQELRLGNQLLGTALPRSFASGSYGYGLTGPLVIQLPDGGIAEVQAAVSLTVKYSKPAEQPAA